MELAPTLFEFKTKFQSPFFNKGMYLVEIEKVALNSRKEPVITFKVLDGFEGKMKNARRTQNFFINDEDAKGRDIWEDKFTDVMRALALDQMTDLSILVKGKLTMGFSEPGRKTTPFFTSEARFDTAWQPKAKPVVENKAA